ncbi:GGDEF domain-containing protein [Salinisphaera sp. Q1T1-3]|uniref:GGDEF domain-containing protein n=1 Tax=Salinisphaera sp. Q1T1-3 TaxID=2321229 RepID=UPI000E75ABD5|nr:GGDEF domain-containing protein [Salinisphaera sp. Q1T1-3]RJS93590.1 GGDEF domain-containing protein [Salinisphaera sp. Q1T1-3]
MMLDQQTLYLSAIVSRLAFLVVFVVIIVGQPRERHLWCWLIALLSAALGLMMLYRASIPALGYSIGCGLILLSLFFSWCGVRYFYGRRPRGAHAVLCLFGPLLLHIGCLVVGAPAHVALSPLYLASALIALLIVVEVVTSPDKRLITQYVIAAAYFGYGLGFLQQGLTLLINASTPVGLNNTNEALALFDQVGSIMVYFAYIAMSTERANRQLAIQAETDPLTGLRNRRGGQRALHEIELVPETTSVLVGDLDHFKRINDRLGHDQGDRVLCLLAARLTRGARRADVIVRWGGEEFLLVLPNTDRHGAMQIAERIRETVMNEPFDMAEVPLPVTISIGVATLKAEDADIEAAIKRADAALYCAKQSGRNRVCTSDERSERDTAKTDRDE